MSIIWYFAVGFVFLILFFIIVYELARYRFVLSNTETGRDANLAGNTAVLSTSGIPLRLSGNQSNFVHVSPAGTMYVLPGQGQVFFGVPPQGAETHFSYEGQLVRLVNDKNIVLAVRRNLLTVADIRAPIPGISYNWTYKNI